MLQEAYTYSCSIDSKCEIIDQCSFKLTLPFHILPATHTNTIPPPSTRSSVALSTAPLESCVPWLRVESNWLQCVWLPTLSGAQRGQRSRGSLAAYPLPYSLKYLWVLLHFFIYTSPATYRSCRQRATHQDGRQISGWILKKM